MRRLVLLMLLAVLVLAAPVGASPGDTAVTDRPYVRHDGGTDPTIEACGSDATTPETGGDGAGNERANQSSVAIDSLVPRRAGRRVQRLLSVLHGR